jgi:hypothetical protein
MLRDPPKLVLIERGQMRTAAQGRVSMPPRSATPAPPRTGAMNGQTDSAQLGSGASR